MRIRWAIEASAFAVVALGMSGTQSAAAPRQERVAVGAIATPTSLTGRSPQSRALYLNLIEDMRRSGQAHAALAHLDAFDKQYPRSADAGILRADCLVDLADYVGASKVYRQLTHGKEAAAAYAGLGRVEALGGRWPAAIDQYAHAVTRKPTSPTYLNDYGYALLQGGRAPDALFRMRQAAELAPNDLRVRNNLILTLAATGNDAGARDLIATIADPAQRAEIETAMAAQRTQAAQSQAQPQPQAQPQVVTAKP